MKSIHMSAYGNTYFVVYTQVPDWTFIGIEVSLQVAN